MKILFTVPFALLFLFSCGTNQPQNRVDHSINQTSVDSMQTVLAQKDSLIAALTPGSFLMNPKLDAFCHEFVDDFVLSLNGGEASPFISHFGNQYGVSWIDLTEGTQIVRYSQDDFEHDFQRTIKKRKKHIYELKDFKILNYDLSNGLFSAIVKFHLSESTPNKPVQLKSITFDIVGRKSKGFSVANLSTVIIQSEK